LHFVSGSVVGGWLSPPSWGQARRTARTTDLKRVDLGSWCEGKEATVQLLECGPGTSDRHFYPAHSFAFVLEGSETQTVPGRAPVTAKVVEVLYDGRGEIHETTNGNPAKAVIFRIIDKGKDANTYVP
jgi:hypothetical protein